MSDHRQELKMIDPDAIRTIFHEELSKELGPIHEQLKAQNRLLTGDGNPAEGMIVRVDRIEQKMAMHSKIVWAIIASFCTMGATWIYHKMTGKG